MTATVKDPEKTAASLLYLRRRKELTLSYGTLLAQDSFLSLLLSALARNKCLDAFYSACGIESCIQGPHYEADIPIRVVLGGWEDVVSKRWRRR